MVKDLTFIDIPNITHLNLSYGKSSELAVRIQGYTHVRTLPEYWLCDACLLCGSLSGQKQDFLLTSYVIHLYRGILLGVGGVFDYLSGVVGESPVCDMKISLKWLLRVFIEPKKYGLRVRNATNFSY